MRLRYPEVTTTVSSNIHALNILFCLIYMMISNNVVCHVHVHVHVASYQALQEEEGKGPGTHCTRMRRGTPEKCGVIGYYRILFVYCP